MKNYDVSLIIPVYNVENYIRETLNSALNQTFDSIELIIVDDCGADNSMYIVESIVESHQRGADIRIVRHSKNKGISEARNTGIKEASGKYIFFMDSDDKITPDCIEKHYAKITNSEADFTIGYTSLIGSKYPAHIRNKEFDTLVDQSVLESFFKKKWMTSACNKLYNKHFLCKNNITFISGRLHEDIVWCYDIARCAKMVSVVNENTYIYIIRENSITTSKIDEKRIADFYYMINHIYSDRKTMDTSMLRSFDNYIANLKLKIATMLLNSTLTYKDQVEMHKRINEIQTPTAINIKTILLSLPFVIFKMLISTPLYLYKKMK